MSFNRTSSWLSYFIFMSFRLSFNMYIRTFPFVIITRLVHKTKQNKRKSFIFFLEEIEKKNASKDYYLLWWRYTQIRRRLVECVIFELL